MLINDTNTTLMLGSNEASLFLALVFCFGLMAFGFKDKRWFIIAGPIWIFAAAAIFINYGQAFMYIGVAVGLALFIDGVYEIT